MFGHENRIALPTLFKKRCEFVFSVFFRVEPPLGVGGVLPDLRNLSVFGGFLKILSEKGVFMNFRRFFDYFECKNEAETNGK